MIIECPNADCGNWLHAKCVVEQAAKAAGMLHFHSFELDLALTLTQQKKHLARPSRILTRSVNLETSTPIPTDHLQLPKQSKATSPQNSISRARQAPNPMRSPSSQQQRSPKSSSQIPKARSKHRIFTVCVARNPSSEEAHGSRAKQGSAFPLPRGCMRTRFANAGAHGAVDTAGRLYKRRE